MAVYSRPPREICKAAAAGDMERARKSGFTLQWGEWDPETRRNLLLVIAPLPTAGRIAAARQEWIRVIHVIIAQKVAAASARDQT